MKKTIAIIVIAISALASCRNTSQTTPGVADFPLVDYHVHLKGGLTLDEAIAISKKNGVKFGIAQNCGLGFP
ncbi:MAG: hypothetical protein JW720_02620, partial [Sedimentisphaerales bacterium]|nr:hypothetical protein [Sedimentisphaerales bacterium]